MHTLNIYESFLLQGSANEVNISGAMRKKAVKFYNENLLEEETDPERVNFRSIMRNIHPCMDEIKMLILTDLWPRFAQSDAYDLFMQKCDPESPTEGNLSPSCSPSSKDAEEASTPNSARRMFAKFF